MQNAISIFRTFLSQNFRLHRHRKRGNKRRTHGEKLICTDGVHEAIASFFYERKFHLTQNRATTKFLMQKCLLVRSISIAAAANSTLDKIYMPRLAAILRCITESVLPPNERQTTILDRIRKGRFRRLHASLLSTHFKIDFPLHRRLFGQDLRLLAAFMYNRIRMTDRPIN